MLVPTTGPEAPQKRNLEKLQNPPLVSRAWNSPETYGYLGKIGFDPQIPAQPHLRCAFDASPARKPSPEIAAPHSPRRSWRLCAQCNISSIRAQFCTKAKSPLAPGLPYNPNNLRLLRQNWLRPVNPRAPQPFCPNKDVGPVKREFVFAAPMIRVHSSPNVFAAVNGQRRAPTLHEPRSAQ